MNIKPYLLPASIAAVLHTALALLSPTPPPPSVGTVAETKRPPEKVVEIDLPPPPQEEKPLSAEPVKSISQGSQPVELPEPPTRPPSVGIAFEVTRAVYQTDSVGPLGPIGQADGNSPFANGVPSIVDVTGLDRTPRATAQMQPNYPLELRRSGISGEVLVEFVVDSTGRVTTAQVLKSTLREFEQPTLHAVLRWRFEPGKRNNRAVPFRMVVPVTFSLGGF